MARGEAFAPRDSALRGQLLWEPDGATRVLILNHFARQTGIASNWIAIATTQIRGATPCPGRNGPPDAAARTGCQAGYPAGGFVRPPADDLTVSVNFLQPMDNTFYGSSVHVDHDFGFAKLTSISAYEGFHFFRNWDEDGTVIQALNIQENIHFHQVSQELRLAGKQGPADWILGVFYSDDAYHDVRNIYAGTLVNGIGSINYVGAPTRVATPSPHYATRLTTANNLLSDLTQDTESAALFTDDKWALTDRLQLVAGYRYTYEKRRFFGNGSVVFMDGTSEYANQNGVGPAVGDQHIETHRSSGRLGLDFQVDPRKLLYVLFSEGFKSGGFDGGPSSNYVVTFKPYEEEVVRSEEVGFKTDWAHFRLNGALFYTTYDNPQAKIRNDVLAADGVTIIPQTQLGNLDKAIVKGAELEALWRPIGGLTFDATGSFLHSRISAWGTTAQFGGNVLPFAPKFSGTLGALYDWPIVKGLLAGVGVDGKYVGTHYLRPENFVIDKEKYTLVNVRAHLGSDTGRWDVELYGKNVGSERYRVNAAGGIGADVFAIGQPALWGLAARINLQ